MPSNGSITQKVSVKFLDDLPLSSASIGKSDSFCIISFMYSSAFISDESLISLSDEKIFSFGWLKLSNNILPASLAAFFAMLRLLI